MEFIGEQIYNVIPNRYPLMLLDSLIIEGSKAVSVIELKGTEWFFECHYPGTPIMPLSLLIECMSQTFSSTFLSLEQTTIEIPSFVSIGNDGKIVLRDKLIPGDKVTIEAELTSYKRGLAKGFCKTYKNDGEHPIIEFEIVEALPSKMIRCRG